MNSPICPCPANASINCERQLKGDVHYVGAVALV